MKKRVLSAFIALSFVFGIASVSFAEGNDRTVPLSPRAVIDIADGEIVGITGPVTGEWLKGQFDGEVSVVDAHGNTVEDSDNVPSDSMVVAYGSEIAGFTLTGDVSRDGNISISDASMLLKHIAKWDVDISLSAADADRNGKVNISDASTVLKYIAKWDVTLGERAMLSVSFDEYVLLASDPETDSAIIESVKTSLGKDVTVVTEVTDGMRYITVGMKLWTDYDFMDDVRVRALFPENSYIDTYGGNIYLTACGDEGLAGCVEFLSSAETLTVPRGYTGTVGQLTGESARLYAEAVERILAAEEAGAYAYELTDDIYTALANAEYTKPKNIIYMIGDGMGTGATTSAEVIYGAGMYGETLAMNHMPVRGMSTTFSAEDQYTDSAAGGTALATGYKTTEGTVAMDPAHTVDYKSLLEIANDLDKSTGVVVTCSVTDATPAAFTVHVKDRTMYSEIARQQLQGTASGKIDLILGGGNALYQAADVVPVIDDAVAAGVTFTNDFDTAKNASLPVIGLFGPYGIYTMENGEPSVSEMTDTAIEKLSENENGFFLMVEGSEIDGYGHENKLREEAEQVYEFDRAVAVALRYAALNPDTVVIVTADHETGGLSVPPTATPDTIDSVSRYFMGRHDWINVPVYAVGYGAGELSEFVDNTHISRYTASLMGEEDFGNSSVIKTLFELDDPSVKNAFINEDPDAVTADKYGIVLKMGGACTEYRIPMENVYLDDAEYVNARSINVTYRNMGNSAVNLPGIKVFDSGAEYRMRDWCIFVSPGESVTMSYIFPKDVIGEGKLMSFESVSFYGSASAMLDLQISDITVTCYEGVK